MDLRGVHQARLQDGGLASMLILGVTGGTEGEGARVASALLRSVRTAWLLAVAAAGAAALSERVPHKSKVVQPLDVSRRELAFPAPLTLSFDPSWQLWVFGIHPWHLAVPVGVFERPQLLKLLVPLPLQDRLPLKPNGLQALQSLGRHFAFADPFPLVGAPVGQLLVLRKGLRHLCVAILLAVGHEPLKVLVPLDVRLRPPLKAQPVQGLLAVCCQLALTEPITLIADPAVH
mmetsp:Transcript_33888/g.96005  ORF Transcript_33888/g.96005 Transcript_33888/m.96005 type:complete len:232 (-) Transcript_33888:2002-2697(-)